MGDTGHVLGQAGLRFFGKVSASISHEIKNALAGIHENAGLLSDLSALVAKGTPVDPERFQRIAERVMGEVRRADAIVQDMNAFSHSIDVEISGVDLHELIPRVVRLFARTAAVRGCSLQTTLPPAPLQLTTAPFFLQHLLWVLLEGYTGRGSGTRRLEIGAGTRDETLHIRLRPAEGGLPECGLLDAEVPHLACKLNADIIFNPKDREIVLTLPRRLERTSQDPAGTKQFAT